MGAWRDAARRLLGRDPRVWPTLREVALRALRELPRVIVVDDGSCDGTAEALTGLPVVLLRNRRNRGKAMSLWRGFRYRRPAPPV